MNKDEVFEKVMGLFKKHGFIKDQKFESAKTSDGKTLQWEGELKGGTPINIVGDDGNSTPAEGTFEMDNGQKVVCIAGLVTEIMAKEAPKADAPDFTKAFEEIFGKFKTVMDEFTAMQGKFNESQAKFADMQAKFDAIDKTVKESSEKQVALMKDLGEQLEAFGKAPAVETTPPANVVFKQKDKEKEEKRMQEFANIANQLYGSNAKA